MSGLIFLLTRSVKNIFLEALRRPAKIVLYTAAVAGIAGIMLLSYFTRRGAETFLDLVWLKGIFFLFLVFFAGISVQKGLASGNNIFDMSDVNLLFVSPVSPRAILAYGLARMAKTAFYAGFFIIAQGYSICAAFGTGFGAVLLLLLAFALAVVLLLILSMIIYRAANGRPARKLAVRLAVPAAFLPLAVYGVLQFARTGDPRAALEKALASPAFAWTPVAGWASEGAVALIRGDGAGFLFLSLLPLAGALLAVYFALSNPDYYEDVLAAAETSFERKRAVAEGRAQDAAFPPKRARVTKTGLGGSGAAALFYKQLRESFRANRWGLWGFPSFFMIAAAAVAALFVRGSGGMPVVLQILMLVQIYLIGTGRGIGELYFHYVYLIPESSFSKILWGNLELVFRTLAESVFMFGAAGLILGEGLPLVALSGLVYALFSLLLISVNYLSLRWTGASPGAGPLVFLYTLAVAAVMLPGVIIAVAAGILLEG
ncbi:MAG: putative ABC exporter domain-containing protein, partial [Treponema sp.]|nr:putative ABC exporter domain-containing protein [Treponema sp.]